MMLSDSFRRGSLNNDAQNDGKDRAVIDRRYRRNHFVQAFQRLRIGLV